MVKWLFNSSVQDHEYVSPKELNIREVSKSWRIYFTNVIHFNLSTIWDLKRDYSMCCILYLYVTFLKMIFICDYVHRKAGSRGIQKSLL